MTMTGLENDVAAAYRNFAAHEAHGNSSAYEAICALIADDERALPLIAALPAAKRQPNLVLAAARLLGARTDEASAFVTWLREHWDAVRDVVLERATQTNEVGRCATLLPFIAQAARESGAQSIALVEIGCSAGLTLYPDLYRYAYVTEDGRTARRGTGAPELTCEVGAASEHLVASTPDAPMIAWRGGLDLNPLDVVSDDAAAQENTRWLQALVWPGQDERSARLGDAIATVRVHVAAHPQDAPHVVPGDVVDDLDRLLDDVPEDRHLVLFHSAVLAYVDGAKRDAFERRMAELGSRPGGFTWISNEAPSVMPRVRAALTAMDAGIPAGRFVLAVHGVPRAVTGPHGQTLSVLDPGDGSRRQGRASPGSLREFYAAARGISRTILVQMHETPAAGARCCQPSPHRAPSSRGRQGCAGVAGRAGGRRGTMTGWPSGECIRCVATPYTSSMTSGTSTSDGAPNA